MKGESWEAAAEGVEEEEAVVEEEVEAVDQEEVAIEVQVLDQGLLQNQLITPPAMAKYTLREMI